MSVWNTINNGRKRAPTMTELQSAPATKSARKTPAAAQKEVRGGGRERNSTCDCLTTEKCCSPQNSCDFHSQGRVSRC
jgi:hypothetical protein